MLTDTPSISSLSQVIAHATAPAFMLGAVTGFLSILISRVERVIDKKRDFLKNSGSSDSAAGFFARRIEILNSAIYMAVLSALATAALLIVAFMMALFNVQHEKGVAMLFVLALVLLMVSLIQLTLEVRIARKTIHLE
jgi:hypothetical protein